MKFCLNFHAVKDHKQNNKIDSKSNEHSKQNEVKNF